MHATREQLRQEAGNGSQREHSNRAKKRTFDQAQNPQDHQNMEPDTKKERQHGCLTATHLPKQHRSSAIRRHASSERCLLLELPAELREHIWSFAVVEWTCAPGTESSASSASSASPRQLQRRPIRMDRFNRPPPPAITMTCHQIRDEALHLYYQLNEFECWRPLFWLKDWTQSTFIDWLSSLDPKRQKWLRSIILLYKHDSELEYDIETALGEEGFELQDGIISSRQELSEYEMCFEEMGLPRHFGKKRRWDRWMAGSAS